MTNEIAPDRRQPDALPLWAVALRQRREALGLSIREAGLLLDVAFENLGHMERGRRSPSEAMLARLHAAYDEAGLAGGDR